MTIVWKLLRRPFPFGDLIEADVINFHLKSHAPMSQFFKLSAHLILREISKIGATRCHILRIDCTKFDFGRGSALDPAGV